MSGVWDIPGRDVDAGVVGALDPVEVLVDVDGPRLYVARGPAGDELLVYQCAEESGRFGWVVVPTDAQAIEQVRAGQVAVRDALQQPWAWFVTQGYDGTVQRARRVRIADVPASVLPAPGVTLVAPETPFLVVRATGQALTERDVPASVIRKVIDGAIHAMKTLIEHALEVTPSGGRPSDRLRRYYDLPTRRLAFGSFEAVFGEPSSPTDQPLLPEDRAALARASALLRRGIAEVDRASGAGEEVHVDDDLGTAFDALSGLLPPASGAIEEVHLSGRLVGTARVRLGREHGARVRRGLRRTRPTAQPIVVQGAIRELDKDAMTFIVRSGDLSREWPCRFSSAVRDDVFTAFSEDYQVAVSGHQRAGKPEIEVVAVEPLG